MNQLVKLNPGTKEVLGYKDYSRTGFLIDGSVSYIETDTIYDRLKEKFPYLTKVQDITVTGIKQTI